MYCTPESEQELRNRLQLFSASGIHFIDSGNYHYVTKLFLEKVLHPFSLVLFDYHDDMQIPMIHNLTSCGGWAREVLERNNLLYQLILIGPEQRTIDMISKKIQGKLLCISIQELEQERAKEKLEQISMEVPLYISIDKDVLNRYESRTNWNQGRMSVDTLEKILYRIFVLHEVIGVDICGECDISEVFPEFVEDNRINQKTNKKLYYFLKKYF